MGSELGLDLKLCAARAADAIVPAAIGPRAAQLEEALRGLEDERAKIEAFKRELPFSIRLVADVIAILREEMDRCRIGRCGVVELEEFMPVKSKLEEEEEDEEEEEVKMEKDCRDKMNWMSSAQLWSSNYSDTSINKNNQTNTNTNNTDNKINKCMNEETESPSLECKSRCGGGAFMPFKGMQALTVSSKKEEKAVASLSDFSLLSAGIKVSPSTDSTEDRLNSKARASINSPMGGHLSHQQQQQQHQASRKARRCWSPELHRRFVLALQQLGGAQVATPKQIRELMKVDGLTNDEVKSHLQKYRLHTRRVPNKSQVNGPIMVVGGLWVPQDQYTASSQQSASLSESPQGPLQIASSARAVSVTAGDSFEEDGKSESYSWK